MVLCHAYKVPKENCAKNKDIAVFNICGQNSREWCLEVHPCRVRVIVCKLQHRMFLWDNRRTFVSGSMVGLWNRLPREALESSFLKVFLSAAEIGSQQFGLSGSTSSARLDLNSSEVTSHLHYPINLCNMLRGDFFFLAFYISCKSRWSSGWCALVWFCCYSFWVWGVLCCFGF